MSLSVRAAGGRLEHSEQPHELHSMKALAQPSCLEDAGQYQEMQLLPGSSHCQAQPGQLGRLLAEAAWASTDATRGRNNPSLARCWDVPWLGPVVPQMFTPTSVGLGMSPNAPPEAGGHWSWPRGQPASPSGSALGGGGQCWGLPTPRVLWGRWGWFLARAAVNLQWEIFRASLARYSTSPSSRGSRVWLNSRDVNLASSKCFEGCFDLYQLCSSANSLQHCSPMPQIRLAAFTVGVFFFVVALFLITILLLLLLRFAVGFPRCPAGAQVVRWGDAALAAHPPLQEQQEKAERSKVDTRAQHTAATAKELSSGGARLYQNPSFVAGRGMETSPQAATVCLTTQQRGLASPCPHIPLPTGLGRTPLPTPLCPTAISAPALGVSLAPVQQRCPPRPPWEWEWKLSLQTCKLL